MRIAIDCRLWNFPGAADRFSGAALVPALLQAASGHEVFLIFDQAPPAVCRQWPGVVCLVLKPAASSAATRALWYDLRLPALLSGHQIQLFIGTAGYISLRTPVRQALLLHDSLLPQRAPAATGWPGSWYSRRLPAMVARAACVFSPSRILATAHLPAAAAASCTVLPFCPLPYPLHLPEPEMRASVKQRLCSGAEYFLCEEGWDNLDDAIELLMAFSAFKKRQQSGMKLVLLGKGPSEKDWPEKLATFRYRDDVVLAGHGEQNDRLQLYSAAYAVVHLPAQPYWGGVQLAMCSGVPVITWPHAAIRELAEDAVLYCTEAPGESLAHNLMRLYKDERFRSSLVAAGLRKAAEMEPARQAAQLLQHCLHAV